MKRVFLLPLLLVLLSFGAGIDAIKDFFGRSGYVVEKLGDKVIIDLGKGKAYVGEVFSVVKEGKEVVHPVTGEVIGRIDQEVGKVKVEEVKEKFSFARILEDKGIERGDRVKLSPSSVCYVGSEEGYFKVSSLVGGLKKGEGCDYVVREFEDGFGVAYRGKALAFFEKPKPAVVREVRVQKVPEDFKLSARFVITFPALPLSADACNFFGRDYLAVLFPSKLVIYEVLDKDIVEYATMNLPSGYPVSVQCAPLEGESDLILLNMVSGGEASSYILKLVGGTPVVSVEGVPYLLAVLDKSRAKDTFVGQKFDARDLWGEVKRLELSAEGVVEKGDMKVPSGFRLDSAVMMGDLLLFTDRDGYLRLFKGEEMLLSEENFDGSYTTAELPGTYEDSDKYTFNVRHPVLKIGKRDYLGAVRNVRSPVYKFLDVTKFSEGDLFVVHIDERGKAELKKVMGKKFEEAIQSVVRTKNGRMFVITGRTGTLPLQNRGDLFEVEISPY